MISVLATTARWNSPNAANTIATTCDSSGLDDPDADRTATVAGETY